MTAPDSFAAVILTHGRPDRIKTIPTLRKHGYTGPIHLVIDDEDPTGPQYLNQYPPDIPVHTFSKTEWATRFDLADTTNNTRAIIYARNAAPTIMRDLGYQHIVQLDDDYNTFEFRWPDHARQHLRATPIRDLDTIFTAMIDLLETTGAATVAMAQGGDFVGGVTGTVIHRGHVLRKAMNSFVINTARPPTFVGRINEDVNTYVTNGQRGHLYFTTTSVSLVQTRTQSNPGGMTDIYLDLGTYIKSFYTLMMSPSCTRIGRMGQTDTRYHHHIMWDHAVPKILPAHHRKPETP